MSVALRKSRLLPASEERRRFQRVKVDLLGRYMLSDRREYPCQIVNISPGGMAILAPMPGVIGERVVAYIDHIGRVEGQIVRMIENGFAMTLAATPRKRDKLAAQLTWLSNRDILGLPEDRRHERIVPRNPITQLVMPGGLNVTCRIIDVSLSGAAVATDQRPPVGSVITLGKVAARVIRHLEEGIAVEFTRLQHPDTLEDSVSAR